MQKLPIVLAVCAAAATPLTALAVPINVGLELALLTDVSSSVSNFGSPSEYQLQLQGYANAFRDSSVISLIEGFGGNASGGGIAVSYVEWSGPTEQAMQVNWFHIYDAASSNAFADAILGTTRRFFDGTAPGNALNFITPLFGTETGGTDNGFFSTKQVIDVSGDGRQNSGLDTIVQRDAALAAGIDTINGLAILGSDPDLLTWYQEHIQSANGFTMSANGFNAFGDAILAKILHEIDPGPGPGPGPGPNPDPTTGVPEPSSLALLAIGFGGLGWSARARRKS